MNDDTHSVRVDLRSQVTEPDTAGRTTLGRALNGRDLAALALNGTGWMAIEDYEAGLVDALVNLMHYARRYEIDFADAARQAVDHHDAESRFGWDEVPQ